MEGVIVYKFSDGALQEHDGDDERQHERVEPKRRRRRPAGQPIKPDHDSVPSSEEDQALRKVWKATRGQRWNTASSRVANVRAKPASPAASSPKRIKPQTEQSPNGLTLHKPNCSEASLRSELVDVFSSMNLCHSWYAFVPSYVGNYDCLDEAVKAVVRVRRQRVDDRTVDMGTGVDHYMHAINLLRPKVDDSDTTLVTIALLCLYESTLRRRIGPCVSHRKGITAIAMARGTAKKSSDVGRAVLYANWAQDFRTSVAEGVPSPFEDAEWVLSGPAYRTMDLLPGISKLRELANLTYIRLPRLIALVRRLREDFHDQPDSKQWQKADLLASELNDLQDSAAESYILHRVHVYQTGDYHAGPIVPYSFEFLSMDEFNAALMYWSARLIVINLCIIIFNLRPSDIETQSGLDTQSLKDDQHRTVKNVLMSWEYTYENGLVIGSPAMTQGVLGVWKALTTETKFNGISIRAIKDWLEIVFRESVAGWPTSFKFKDAEMDETGDIFAGGPICGLVAKIYN